MVLFHASAAGVFDTNQVEEGCSGALRHSMKSEILKFNPQ